VVALWRCHDDATFAALAGPSPLPASSGRIVRHRPDDRTELYRPCPFLHEQLTSASPDLLRPMLTNVHQHPDGCWIAGSGTAGAGPKGGRTGSGSGSTSTPLA
jgi:hypothetical protein